PQTVADAAAKFVTVADAVVQTTGEGRVRVICGQSGEIVIGAVGLTREVRQGDVFQVNCSLGVQLAGWDNGACEWLTRDYAVCKLRRGWIVELIAIVDF